MYSIYEALCTGEDGGYKGKLSLNPSSGSDFPWKENLYQDLHFGMMIWIDL